MLSRTTHTQQEQANISKGANRKTVMNRRHNYKSYAKHSKDTTQGKQIHSKSHKPMLQAANMHGRTVINRRERQTEPFVKHSKSERKTGMNTRENHTTHVNHSNYSAKARHKATKTNSNLMEPT